MDNLTEEVNYNKEYFINKFEAIPEEQWCTGTLIREFKGITQHCALGHCGTTVVNHRYVPTPEAVALVKLFSSKDPNFNPNHPDWTNVYLINDRCNKGATYGNTPKQRILNYLKQLP